MVSFPKDFLGEPAPYQSMGYFLISHIPEKVISNRQLGFDILEMSLSRCTG